MAGRRRVPISRRSPCSHGPHRSTDRGLYCPAGDFHVDPWRPVGPGRPVLPVARPGVTHGLLIRMPMRKTTKSPSMRAVARLVMMSGKAHLRRIRRANHMLSPASGPCPVTGASPAGQGRRMKVLPALAPRHSVADLAPRRHWGPNSAAVQSSQMPKIYHRWPVLGRGRVVGQEAGPSKVTYATRARRNICLASGLLGDLR